MARWLVIWARGVSASQPYFVIRTCLTPYMPRSAAEVAPAGPLPTTRTSVSIFTFIFLSRTALGSFGRRHHRQRRRPRAWLHPEFVGHEMPSPGHGTAVRQQGI